MCMYGVCLSFLSFFGFPVFGFLSFMFVCLVFFHRFTHYCK